MNKYGDVLIFTIEKTTLVCLKLKVEIRQFNKKVENTDFLNK